MLSDRGQCQELNVIIVWIIYNIISKIDFVDIGITDVI